MRITALITVIPLLATATAKVDRRNRNHRDIIDRINPRDGYFDAPELEPGETLVQIIKDPKSSTDQWRTFDGTSFRPFSTSTHHPTATAITFANKALVGGGTKVVNVDTTSPTQSSSQSDVQPTSGAAGVVSQEEVNEWLRVHDTARAQHGAGRLQWDEDLAIGAKSNAIQCKGIHTAERGENIVSNTVQLIPQTAVDQWMDEAKYYSGKYQDSTSHYTQVIWKRRSTTHVGCYLQTCAPGTRYAASYGTSWQATCRYSIAGNNIAEGYFADNTQA